jgi:hypothetical protein
MGAWVYKRTTGLPLPPTRAPPRSPIASLHIVHTTVCPLSLSRSLRRCRVGVGSVGRASAEGRNRLAGKV